MTNVEKKGKFVTFEGCEGVGKSTQMRLVKEYCETNGIDAVFTREPGGTDISEQIRNVILLGANSNMDAICELMLYSASRRQHVAEKIVPAINAGKTVFCDRFFHSTLAYQGYARGMSKEMIVALNDFATGGLQPDLVIFIDVDPETGFLRKGGATKDDRLESEGIEFHKLVYKGYCSAFENASNVARIDACGDKYDTHGKIITALKQKGVL